MAALDQSWVFIFVWGLIATAIMTTVTEGAQLTGFSRMSLPFLFGTFVTNSRRRAQIFGYLLYSLGGFLFAIFYVGAFITLGFASWWLGTIMGFVHGLFLVTVLLPLMPYVHPRMASEYDGPTPNRRLEPPGPFGMNYGRLTPTITVLAQTVYGLVLGAAFSFHSTHT